jgi:hypothetical protein
MTVRDENCPKKTWDNITSVSNGYIHIAIVDSHTAHLILQGKKHIETRFSINKHIPYGRISEGEIIFIKISGGPIVGVMQAERVCFYADLNVDDVNDLKSEYNDLIQAKNEYWKQKRTSRFATFIYLSNIEQTEPFWLNKKDRSGWCIYERCEFSKHIKSNGNGNGQTVNSC